MIRLFNVYYPVRTLLLLAGEGLAVWTSFLLGFMLRYRQDSYLVLNFEYGYDKIFAATALVLLLSHWFGLYDPEYCRDKGEILFRLMMVPGIVALVLAFVGFVFPGMVRGNSASLGLLIATIALFGWRRAHEYLVQLACFRETVFVLGAGDRAENLIRSLHNRPELGVEVVGWGGDEQEAVAQLAEFAKKRKLQRVVVALPDRRGTLPVSELLQLRLEGIKIEEATSWMEKITGRIEVQQLYPSWFVFGEGFRYSASLAIIRRLVSLLASAVLLLVVLPFIPLVILLIKLDSPGPVLYRQQRVGLGGATFYCYKFRTMCENAEADTGPTWACDNDPRITRVGRFLRLTRLDEIPQLWCVLKGDMAFVGPRPERPEFVDWLSKEVPYYTARHSVPPGITGWAQIRYKYGNTLQDALEKLQYDLYYVKNRSLGLDLFIILQTIKIVTIGRGAV